MVAAATQLGFNPQWIAEFIANTVAFTRSPIAPYLTDHVLFTGPGADLTTTPSRASRPFTRHWATPR